MVVPKPGVYLAYDGNGKFMGVLYLRSGYPIKVRWAGESAVLELTEKQLGHMRLDPADQGRWKTETTS
jgi:hypothetical protein